jgi:cysteine desulfurase
MPLMKGIYLDHNATTPLDPRVREVMLTWLGVEHGNPSSIHRFGQQARGAVERAREQVASLLSARPPEIVFTASGSEANNTVLATVASSGPGGHVVISALEHPSIQVMASHLEAQGIGVTRVAPERSGVVDARAIDEALRVDTRLVCLMLAHNELGTVQPVAEVAGLCRQRGIPVLCDAVQAVGKIPVSASELGVDYLTVGAHKFHGPLGAAALWIRTGAALEPFLRGGSQERRRRAGTENVPAIVGFGHAAALAEAELPSRAALLARLRDAFEQGAQLLGGVVHCATSPRLPSTSHLGFEGIEGEALLIRLDLDGFAVSTGSACSSGTVEPSKSVLACGFTPEEALSSVRVSFGITNQASDVHGVLEALSRELAALGAIHRPAAVIR